MPEPHEIVDTFLDQYFANVVAGELAPGEQALIDEIMQIVRTRFARQKYVVGLVIDFSVVAQQLAEFDPQAQTFRPDLEFTEIADRYNIVRERNGREANTLTLQYAGHSFGIRRIEEQVLRLFNELKRPSYPTAYVYNTGMWKKPENERPLVIAFRLSNQGRLQLCKAVIQFGLQNLPQNNFFTRPVERVRLFELVVRDYPRVASRNENGGAVFQAIAFGYVTTQYAHLDVIADKARAGSARQKRFGDVDGYMGLDLELSVEVKDMEINNGNLARQLGSFLETMEQLQTVGLVLVKAVTDDARTHIEGRGVHVLTQDDLLREVARWDWHKQNRAVLGLLHQLAHVEQSPHAVQRLLSFIAEQDDQHDALVYYTPEQPNDVNPLPDLPAGDQQPADHEQADQPDGE